MKAAHNVRPVPTAPAGRPLNGLGVLTCVLKMNTAQPVVLHALHVRMVARVAPAHLPVLVSRHLPSPIRIVSVSNSTTELHL